MIRTTRRSHMFHAVVFSLFVVFATACADLSAIREFADISAKSAEYTSLVNDYVESPKRQKQFHPQRQHERLNAIAEERAWQKERLLYRLTLIEEYMDALGHLASDESVTYDKEIDSLGAAAQDNKFTDPKETEAFTGISKILTKAVSDRWRQKKLKDLIEESNAPLQVVIGALTQTVDQGFAGDLEIERIAITKYYDTILMSASDQAGIAALQEWRTMRLGKLDDRSRSITTYSEILSKIGEGHQELYDERDNLINENVLLQIGRSAKDLRKLLSFIKNQ